MTDSEHQNDKPASAAALVSARDPHDPGYGIVRGAPSQIDRSTHKLERCPGVRVEREEERRYEQTTRNPWQKATEERAKDPDKQQEW